MLLCMFVGTAWAQVQITSIESLTGDEELTFSTSNRGGWAVNDGANKFASTNDLGFGTTVNYRNDQHVFQLKKNDGSLYLFSVYAQKYVNSNATLSETATNALTYVEQGDGTFLFKFDDSHIINLGGSNQMAIDGWGIADAGNKITIMDVTEARKVKAVTVTYKYFIGGKLYTSQEVEVGINSEVEVPAQAFLTVVNYEGTIGEENCEIRVNCTENFPFVTAKSVGDITKWYYMRMHTNNPGYVGDIADDKTINVAGGKTAQADKVENFMWGFVGDMFTGITVVTKGTGLLLTSTGGGNATLTESGTALFVADTS